MSRELQVPNDLIEYTSLTSLDLYGAKNRPAKYLRVVAGAGTLNVIMAGSGGATRPLTMALGEEQVGEFTAIVSAVGITAVRVGWN